MTDLKSLEEERERWLAAIDKSDTEIAEFERAMHAGDASLERGLPYLRDLNESRAELFRGLGSVEARIEFQTLHDHDQAEQAQDKREKQDWTDDSGTVSAARVPPAASREDERNWWKRDPEDETGSTMPTHHGIEWWKDLPEDKDSAERDEDLVRDDDRYNR